MRRLTTLAAAAALAATPVLAQEAGNAGIDEAARNYVQSEAMQTTLDQLLSTDTFIAQIRAGGMVLDDADAQTLAQIVDEEFNEVRPELEDAMTAAAAEAYTVEELEALNAFYDSDEGRSIAEKTAPFMLSFYESVGPTLQQTQQQIALRAQEALNPGAQGGNAPTVTE